MHLKRSFAALAGVVALAVGVMTSCTPDTAPPVLRVTDQPAFVVGTRIGPSRPPENDAYGGYSYTYGISRRLAWTATDTSGICGYDVESLYTGSEPGYVFEDSPQTWLNFEDDDYEGSFGGGSQSVYGYRITAHDCAGNRASVDVGVYPRVAQEDNTTIFGYPAGNPTISYTGQWTRVRCTCASRGYRQVTSEAGARAVIAGTYRDGDHLAVVMAKPSGRADVYLDGTKVGVMQIDTGIEDHRIITFDQRMPAGDHVLELVNRPSTDRPIAPLRLDAVIRSSGFIAPTRTNP